MKNLSKMKLTCPIQFMFVSGVLPIYCYFALNAVVFLSDSTHLLIWTRIKPKSNQSPPCELSSQGGINLMVRSPSWQIHLWNILQVALPVKNLATSSHHIRTQKTGYIYISVLLVRWRILLLDVQPATRPSENKSSWYSWIITYS